MTEAQQPIASANKEIVSVMNSAMFSEGVVICRPARDVMLECAPIGAGLCASAFGEEIPRTSKVASDYRAQAKCINNVAFLFPIPFDTAVASYLGAEKAAVTFNNLWSTVRLAGVNALRLGQGFNLNKDAMMAASIGVKETSGLDDPTFVEKYDGDFLANLVRYVHLGRRQFKTSDFRSDSKDKGGFLPTNYFSPDYYYKDATEKTLNSGTLGTLAAAMLFRLSLPHLDSEPTAYIKCLSDYSRQSLKVEVNEADWMVYTRARWAAEVSLATARHDAGKLHRRELDAIHYLRVARTFCGEEERDRVPLKFIARSSPNFNQTFECNYPYPPMSC